MSNVIKKINGTYRIVIAITIPIATAPSHVNNNRQ